MNKESYFHCVWEGCKGCGRKGDFLIEASPGDKQVNKAYEAAQNAAVEDSGCSMPVIVKFSLVK